MLHALKDLAIAQLALACAAVAAGTAHHAALWARHAPVLVVAATTTAQPAPEPPALPQAAPGPDWDARGNAAADYALERNGDAVLIMHRGRIVFERYDRGWTAERTHALASGTKSFTGVLAAAAIQDGLIASWDETVSDTITEWRSDPRKSRITVRQLLNLSSGLAPTTPELAPGQPRPAGPRDAAQPRRGLRARPDPDAAPTGGAFATPGALTAGRSRVDTFKAAVNAPAQRDPGAAFAYGPTHYFAFGELLQRKLAASGRPEKTFRQYLQSRLFEPLGLPIDALHTDSAGNPDLPGGGALSARHWARFGDLVLLGGAIRSPSGEHTQLVDPELLAECFKPSDANPSYGLTWWLPTKPQGRSALNTREADPLIAPDGSVVTVYMAAGAGKQRLYVLPEHDLVVVRFANAGQGGRRLGQRGQRQNDFSNAEFLARVLGMP